MMIFLQPFFLFALLTLPLILVLHMLRERRRRVTVPSLQHWLNLPHRRDGERIRWLPLTLLLLLHLLVAGLLALALGRPQLPGWAGNDMRETAIVLDTSTSMATQEGSTTRFAQAQQQVRALLSTMKIDDRVVLISAGPRARVAASGDAEDQAALLAALESLHPAGVGTDLDGAIRLAEIALDPQRVRHVVVLTDGAFPTAPTLLSPLPIEWQQIGAEQPNRAIVAFAARPWGRNVQVFARVANYSPAAFSTQLRLYGDEVLVSTSNVQLPVNGETELTWTLSSGHKVLRAELMGQDGLPQDDQAFLGLTVRPVNTLLVSSRPAIMQRALASVPGVVVQVIDPVDYASDAVTSTVGLTVFDGFLPQRWPSGAVLVINPPSANSLLEVGSAVRTAPGGALEQRDSVLEGLSLGGVRFGQIQRVTPPSWARPILTIGDLPLIIRGQTGASEIAIWTFDLSGGNLPTRLAFPLLVARTVRDLMPPALPQAIHAGSLLPLQPDLRANQIRIIGPDGSDRVLQAGGPSIDTLVLPGVYRIEERGGGKTLFQGAVGVNAGATVESDLQPQQVASNAGQLQQVASSQQRMLDLWPWLVLGVLALLMLEWGYILR